MTFECPHCTTSLELDDQFAGQTVACPICENHVLAEIPRPVAVISKVATPKLPPKKGGWIIKMLLLIMILLLSAFSYVMVYNKETPDKSWNRIVMYIQNLISPPPPVVAVVPKPTPTPTPQLTPPPSPSPAPVAKVASPVPTPVPTAVPTPKPINPVEWLAAHKDFWPRQLTLKTDTNFVIIRPDHPNGALFVPAGNMVNLIQIDSAQGAIEIQETSLGGTQTVPISQTDLGDLAKVALYNSEHATPTPVPVHHSISLEGKGLPGYSDPYVVITTTSSATSNANQPIMNFSTNGPTTAFLTAKGVNFSPISFVWSQVPDVSNRFATKGQATFSPIKILPGDAGGQTEVTFSDKGIYQLQVVASDAGHEVTQYTWVNVWDPVPALGPNHTMGRNPSVNPPTSVQVLSHDPGPYCHPRIFFSRPDWLALNAKDLSATAGIPEALAATASLKQTLAEHFDKAGDVLNTMAQAYKAYADAGYSDSAQATLTTAYQGNVDAMGDRILGNAPDKEFYDALAIACYFAWVGTDPNLDHSQVSDDEKARFTYLATIVAAAAKYETITNLKEVIDKPHYTMALSYDYIYDWMTPQQQQDTRDYLYLIGNFYNTQHGGIGRNFDGPAQDGSQQNGGDFPNLADGILLPALAIEGEETGTDQIPGISNSVLKVAGAYRAASSDSQLTNASWPNANRCSVLNLQRQIHYASEYGVTPWGFCCNMMDYFQLGEDTAAPGGFALARRGENEWVTTNLYQAMLHALYNLAPRERDGKMALYDHHDGCGFGDGPGTENEMMIAKYMYPDDPMVDYVYRAFRVEQPTVNPFTTAMFAAPLGSATLPEVAAQKGLSLIKFDAFRGVAISRNGWNENDLNLVFENRFEFRGHNHGERNSFSLFALGRTWACAPGYHVTISDVQSQVLIQQKHFDPDPPTEGYIGTSPGSYNNENVPGRLNGGPFAGKLLDILEDPNKQWTWFSGDAKDSYTYINTKTDKDIGKHSLDYLYPGLIDCLIPSDQERLKEENVQGTLYDPVLYAFRSILTVRGKNPYVIVIDDINKDDGPNNYRWTMSPTISFGTSGGRFIGKNGEDVYSSLAIDQTTPSTSSEAVLFHDPIDAGNKAGLPRLLVRDLNPSIPANAPPIFIKDEPLPEGKEPTIATNMTYGWDNNQKKYGFLPSRRLIIERPGVTQPNYKVLLFPFLTGSNLPTTAWDPTGKVLKVSVEGQVDTITFDYFNEDHRTRMVSFVRAASQL